MIFKMKKKKNT